MASGMPGNPPPQPKSRMVVPALKRIAFAMARNLYNVIFNMTDGTPLMGYEVNCEELGVYQIAFRVERVRDDGYVINISNKDLDDLEYKEIE